jgi:hypothetical protein
VARRNPLVAARLVVFDSNRALVTAHGARHDARARTTRDRADERNEHDCNDANKVQMSYNPARRLVGDARKKLDASRAPSSYSLATSSRRTGATSSKSLKTSNPAAAITCFCAAFFVLGVDVPVLPLNSDLTSTDAEALNPALALPLSPAPPHISTRSARVFPLSFARIGDVAGECEGVQST